MNRRLLGFTLVGTMLGLALSMITGLALLFAYRSIALNATSSISNARKQDQAASGSVEFMMSLGQAGWGVGASASPAGASANTDLVLLDNATVSGTRLSGTAVTIGATSQTGNGVVWDSKISGSMQCSALIASAGGVQRLGPVACNSATEWTGLAWNQKNAMVATGTFGTLTFSAVKSTCWPFGGGPGARSVVEVGLTGINGSGNSVCLSNITS